MEEPNNTCPQCGAPLPPDAPSGLCPNCLMAMNLAPNTQFNDDTDPSGAKAKPPPKAPAPEEIAAFFPQLDILECLGQGGMGVVYKARQKELDRIVALKILPREIGETPGFAERFAREARALAKLNHPGIVTLYEFGHVESGEGETDTPLYFFLMEYVDGVNLRQLMHGDRISAREALAIVPQICDALQFAHDQRIVHRDIKPENILMDRRGSVKVADFGLAKIMEEKYVVPPLGGSSSEDRLKPELQTDLTEAGKVMGTPKYMSPEQINAPGEVDHRADIYALGVVFYQMLTGEMPGKPLQPPSKRVHIDVRLDEIVLRALENDPGRRYSQASVLKTEVETIVAGTTEPEENKPLSGEGDTTTKKSGLVRLIEVVDGKPITSPLAINLINASALGFLGFLSSLGNLPAPGMRHCFLLAGFYGFFFLIAPAVVVETKYRKRGTAKPGSQPPTGSRFSRTAIAGAAWAFFVLGLLPMFISHQVTLPAGEYTGPAWWQILLMILLIPTGLTAPFGSTILGWIAVSQIRRSAGKLYGLGLALFDGLLFPLLALDALIIYMVALLISNYFNSVLILIILQALLFLLVGLLDAFIVRRAWRAMNKPLGGETQSRNPSRTMDSNQRSRWMRRVLVAVALGVIVMTALLFWVQRPRLWDDKTIVADSPDGMFSAMGQTWHAMSVFDTDRTFYRFTVQGKAGSVFEKWEVEVPYEKLATSYVLLSVDEIRFGRHGSIAWSKDGKRASFQVNGIEVSAFNTQDGSHSFQDGYLPQQSPVNSPDKLRDRSTDKVIEAGTERHIEFNRDGETMQNMVSLIRQQYGIRLCLENLDFDPEKDAITLGNILEQLGEKERMGTLTIKEQNRLAIARKLSTDGNNAPSMLFDVGERYDGVVRVGSIEGLLVSLTQGTPYDWCRFSNTYVIRPRNDSKLSFPIKLDSQGLTLEQAINAILDQTTNRISIGQSITMLAQSGTDATPWLQNRLPSQFENISAMEVLCRLSEISDPATVWELAGYTSSRTLGFIQAPDKAIAEKPVFGPEIELTLNEMEGTTSGVLLDLDDGKTLDTKPEMERWAEERQMRWINGSGADLWMHHKNWRLFSPGGNAVRLVSVANTTWDDGFNWEQLEQALLQGDPGVHVESIPEITIYVLGTNPVPPLTFAFATAKGARGLLQVTEVAENPNRITVRLKTALKSGSPSTDAVRPVGKGEGSVEPVAVAAPEDKVVTRFLFIGFAMLFGILIGGGMIGGAVWWIVAGAKAGAAMQRAALVLAGGGPFAALFICTGGSLFGIYFLFLFFPALLAFEIPALCLGVLSRHTRLGKAAIITSLTVLALTVLFTA